MDYAATVGHHEPGRQLIFEDMPMQLVDNKLTASSLYIRSFALPIETRKQQHYHKKVARCGGVSILSIT